MRLPLVNSAQEVEALVREVGLLPFFDCGVEGLSLKACTPEERWFVKDVEGPWEWREAVMDKGEIPYARLFRKKMGFVSPALYPDFVNMRRGGMDFEQLYKDGRASRNEKRIVELLETVDEIRTNDLKRLSGIEKGFETALASLQMRTYVTVRRMDYKRDAFGRPFGWGISCFALSERVFGEDFVCSRYDDPPELSLARLYEHLAALFPEAAEKDVLALLR